MPSINDAWIKKPKSTGIAKPSHAMKERYDDILFKNMPDFTHIKPADRKRCEQQHLQFEELLAGTPVDTLHSSLTGKANPHGFPRQTVVFLITNYCGKRHVAHETLVQHITNANGDVGKEGLITPRPSDNKAVFNLHKLDDTTLWRVYCSLPEDERPAKRPAAAPREPRPVKKSKGGKKPAIKGPMAALQQPVVIEEDVVWACCDGCDKWRRVPGVADASELPSPWYCKMHPDGITCDTCEEEMDADEKWGGDTHGVKYEQPEAEETDADSSAAGGEASAQASDDSEEEDVAVDNLFGSDDDDDSF